MLLARKQMFLFVHLLENAGSSISKTKPYQNDDSPNTIELVQQGHFVEKVQSSFCRRVCKDLMLSQTRVSATLRPPALRPL